MAGGGLCGTLFRKKVYTQGELEDTKLKRCLNRWDLTALGVGGSLGIGIYVLIGSVALKSAGPSVVLSFLIAAVAALFAGLCYGELCARIPKAGSAYSYTYVVVGEFLAFIVGWNIIFEALFGAASLARGLSWYVDTLTNNSISNWATAVAPIQATHLSPYFDFLAFSAVIVFGVLLCVGVRESTFVNNVSVALNVAVVLVIVVAGATRADTNNWYIPSAEVPDNYGTGGFFPYGVWGTLRGTAICFYGFVGFDILSFASEESHHPRRTIPLTMLSVLAVLYLSFTSVAIVITMLVPYYIIQDNVTAIASVFTHVGWNWAWWVASIGAVLGVASGLFGALFPLPRLLSAMSSDGLFICGFDQVNSRKTPVLATLLPTVIIAILSAVIQLDQLIMMVCVGTLLSYTFVAISVILLRYHSGYTPPRIPSYWRQMFGRGAKAPSTATARLVQIILGLFVLTCLSLSLTWRVEKITVIVLHVVAFLWIVVIALQPTVKEELPFKTPIVPVIPCLSIYVNINLMVLISVETWIRVSIWLVIGIIIYTICKLCCKRKDKDNLKENLQTHAHNSRNGKGPVQVVVETRSPISSFKRSSHIDCDDIIEEEGEDEVFAEDPRNYRKPSLIKMEEFHVQQAIIENNEEKEAKIIDLLDKVLQAEEDTYNDIKSLKELKEEVVLTTAGTIPHRQSFSDLSDAGSDASMGNQVLSKYDVIAQVHREDLPKVEEDETEEPYILELERNEHEQVTAFNESDTNSQTDESGYSDTFDLNTQNEITEIPYIPIPPPMDENYFASSTFKKSFTIPPRSPKILSLEDTKPRESLRLNTSTEDKPHIPVPPPMDENYFASPKFKKSFTISGGSPKIIPSEEGKPRESVKSNTSAEDEPMAFGTDRQMNFMSKLNNIFQNKISNSDDEKEETRQRSHSTGNVVENMEFNEFQRPIFIDLKKELLNKVASSSLKSIEPNETITEMKVDEPEETSLSREDLKSKLEVIFANGGPNLLKPRLMKSNPPTPEESQVDVSSSESILKLPKMEKNDTLKRQKAKFGEVLNSFRLSYNKDDDV